MVAASLESVESGLKEVEVEARRHTDEASAELHRQLGRVRERLAVLEDFLRANPTHQYACESDICPCRVRGYEAGREAGEEAQRDPPGR